MPLSDATLTFFTDFADQAVILPVLGTVAVVLSLERRWIVLAAWIGCVGAVLSAVLVLKVACYTCGWMVPWMGPDFAALRSPSGHAASAAVTFAGIAALQGRPSRAVAAWTSLAAAGLAALFIGFTRVALGAHSVSEVAVAAAIGMAGALAFVLLAGRQLHAKSGGTVLVCAALVALAMHGRNLPAEAVIQVRGVAMMRSLVPACDPDARPTVSAAVTR